MADYYNTKIKQISKELRRSSNIPRKNHGSVLILAWLSTVYMVYLP